VASSPRRAPARRSKREYRAAEGKPERYPELVADLLRTPVDLIVSFSVAALPALTKATKDIPVVLATLSDPVREGYAKSFARPGGNITGLTLVNDEFLAKLVERPTGKADTGRLRLALGAHPRLRSRHVNPTGRTRNQPEFMSQRAAAAALSSGRVLNAIAAPGARLCTALITASNMDRL